MWRAFAQDGMLQYRDFIETVNVLIPFYWIRVIGGTLYLVGAVLMGVNLVLTWRNRPKTYEVPVYEAAPLSKDFREPPAPGSDLPPGYVLGVARKLDVFGQLRWHRKYEGLPVIFTILVAIGVVAASLGEIIPLFARKSDIVRIASVEPYTPLELVGRDIYISEGCSNCHSQMIRPLRAETERYGEYSKPGESVYDHPFLWGSRRIGPDLARVGGKYPDLWHVRHFQAPQAVVARSIMPAYRHFLTTPLDFDGIQARVDAMTMLGVPYGEAVRTAPALARAQAGTIAAAIVEQGGPAGLADKQVVAIIAYLQRLGRDIRLAAPATAAAPAARAGGAN